MGTINLMSSDGAIFVTDVQIVKCSLTLKTILDNFGLGNDENDVVPVPNVSSDILRKVLEWVNHHKYDAEPQHDDNKEKRTDDISQWDSDFLKVDQGTLFELIKAAYYLDVKGLLDVTCQTVANMMKGKTPEEIRKNFNIENDFTAEEEKQIREEFAWCLNNEK